VKALRKLEKVIEPPKPKRKRKVSKAKPKAPPAVPESAETGT
jgi:hypothetical protein